ncbi:MAG: hypothetical protein ABI042_10520 [Verrucomicrobiota bacterium]
MKKQNRIRTKSKVAKPAKVPLRARTNRGEVTLRIPEILREHAIVKAKEDGAGWHSYMVDAIRESVLFNDYSDTQCKGVFAKLYGRVRLEKYGDAVSELGSFSRIVRYHPKLSPLTKALHDLYFANDALKKFLAEGAAMAAAGIKSGVSEEEMAARLWFNQLYKRAREMDFLNAQLEFGGFYPWIKNQIKYAEVAKALARFLAAADVLENFLEESKGGAR